MQGGSGSRAGGLQGRGSRRGPLVAQNFTASGEAEARRCARREELLARGCPPGELEEPRGRQEVLQDEPLSQGARGDGATQLAPQRVRVTLRPGESLGGGTGAEGGAGIWMRPADPRLPPPTRRGAPAAPGPLPPCRRIPCRPVLPYGPELLHEGRPGARAPARARLAGEAAEGHPFCAHR